MFVSVFAEADEAKHLGLRQIAGPEYRKAFEYLIKDYAKKVNKEDPKKLEETFSGTVVDQYISDVRIQAVAKRSLWLGNDETHYLRKWSDQTLDDLVTLIRLTGHWIEIEAQSKSYIDEMPEGGRHRSLIGRIPMNEILAKAYSLEITNGVGGSCLVRCQENPIKGVERFW